MLFFRIMLTEFIAEMGDKTQLMLIAMTSRYKLRDIVLGTAAAILVLNGLAVLAGGLISRLVPLWLIRFAAAGAFLYFAFSSLKEEEESEEAGDTNGKYAAVSVFLTFFAAELGDKTQLAAITFGANEGAEAALLVWLACSAGLFAADLAGMAAGILLKQNLRTDLLNKAAFCIFLVYGILTAYQGLQLLL